MRVILSKTGGVQTGLDKNHTYQENNNFCHLLSGKINRRSYYRVFIDGEIKLIWIVENR
jgi:hypothetical protein